MKKKIVSMIAAIAGMFVLSACTAVHVSVDTDPSVNPVTLPTFAIVHSGASLNDLTDNRIRSVITSTLQSKGYTIASASKASFHVIYDYGKHRETGVTAVPTYPMGMGYGMGGYGMGYGMGMYAPYGGYQTAIPYSYVEGQFAIRMIDAKTKKAYWTADATSELSSKKTPEAKTKYAQDLMTKILKKYPVRK